MKRVILVSFMILTLSLSAFASNMEYRLTAGVFGTVGTITFNEQRRGGHYTISMLIKTSGLASGLTHHRIIKMVSKGIYRRGDYLSHYYSFQKKDSKSSYIKEYKIDTRHKKVFKIDNHSKNHQIMKYFTTRDPLSILFELIKHPSSIKSGRYRSVGLESHGGYIQIVALNLKQAQKERSELGVSSNSKIFYMLIPNKGKSPRKIVFAINPKGGLESAYTVAIPVIGVVYIKHK